MPTKYESFETSDDGTLAFYGDTWRGQTFTPQEDHILGSVILYLVRTGNPTGDFTVDIYECDASHHPTGDLLATGSYDSASVGETKDWHGIALTGSPVLTADTEYVILLHQDSGADVNSHIGIRADTDDENDYYTRGKVIGSNDAGSTWLEYYDVTHPLWDALFQEWSGEPKPVVTTQAMTNVGTTTATGNGNITNLGTPNATQHGHCWNTTGNPDINDSKTENGAPAETGAFTSDLTSLAPGTRYYCRAYATNSLGTSYGSQVSFVAGQKTYPVDAITRVTNLTHRYNRATGEYNLIIALGEVTTDFDIPTVDRTPVSSSVQDQPKEEAKAVVEQAQDEGILPPPKPKAAPPAPTPTIPSYTAGTPVVTPEPTPEPVTLTEYAEEVIRKQPYRAAAITQQVKKIPSRPTIYAYDILAEQERRAQELEERQAAARLRTGRIATERTKAIITSSPEAQKRLKEIEEQRKNWWEFWK